ncbi:hypothetical protein CH63R_13787 [Colletotrichum higginsianum IMI 349063]|uniref:Uncharacterized protein n=1 Tax=Colletotrichum higginsianum (strain IMI 349063) TaxID=759273 RepID=A0A1B7XS25_COLHI|nr:hypothetical protein CH63R_13787 [Colletotrichum higginsianum IMI 349063]OBR02561.1 hypothetical protein CH63R_13787 [Colletotrichum higginsianum IMI 349063]
MITQEIISIRTVITMAGQPTACNRNLPRLIWAPNENHNRYPSPAWRYESRRVALIVPPSAERETEKEALGQDDGKGMCLRVLATQTNNSGGIRTRAQATRNSTSTNLCHIANVENISPQSLKESTSWNKLFQDQQREDLQDDLHLLVSDLSGQKTTNFAVNLDGYTLFKNLYGLIFLLNHDFSPPFPAPDCHGPRWIECRSLSANQAHGK